jgi:hypothetical protein
MMNQGLISWAFRAIALATIAMLILTTSESPLVAAPVSRDISTTVASSRATDFSAARRHRHYYRRGNAAGVAFAGMAFGMIAGAIAAEQRREYYENCGYYYGPGSYYGPGYYHAGRTTMAVDTIIRPTRPGARNSQRLLNRQT